ncbi:hypothetical protein [Guggenheimella bovis]
MKRNKSLFIGFFLFLLAVTYYFIKLEQDFPDGILRVTILMTIPYRFLFMYSVMIFITVQQILKKEQNLPIYFRYTNRKELATKITLAVIKTSFLLCSAIFVAVLANCLLLRIPISGSQLLASLIICFLGYFIGICIYEMILLISSFWWSKVVGGVIYFVLIGIDFNLWYIQRGWNLLINRMNFSRGLVFEGSIIKISPGVFLREFIILLLIFFLLRIVLLFTLEKKEFLGVRR